MMKFSRAISQVKWLNFIMLSCRESNKSHIHQDVQQPTKQFGNSPSQVIYQVTWCTYINSVLINTYSGPLSYYCNLLYSKI
jgi:hypothetical protein